MSEDKDKCNCGCHCGDDDCCEDEDFETMTLTLEDGSEMECAIIGIFPVEEKEYIALYPLKQNEEDNEEGGEIFLYGFKEHENDDVELISIESDDEYNKVAEVFNKFMDEEYPEEK